VLDGWGLAPAGPGNAISLAETPNFDELWERYPHTQLTACGTSVGLPEGQMGNSEVGHLNLGAGSVIKQDLVRIDEAIQDGSFSENPILRKAFSASETGRVHLLGLVSDGGVHSSDRHLRALIDLAAELSTEDLIIHAITDGRDTLPNNGVKYLEELENYCAKTGVGKVGTVIGRYFAMDRDKRWDRTQLAYDLFVMGNSEFEAKTGKEGAAAAYERGETDEFIRPTLVTPDCQIKDGDSVIAFNFRPDRMRQITRALAEESLTEIDRHGREPIRNYTTLAEYEEDWSYPVAFPPSRPAITLSHIIADHDLKQLHVAETEKYAHVTYFFNGGEETPYDGESRELVPSPRDVPTYDHKPEMSAPEVAEAFIKDWKEKEPSFAIINFANPDMVGHTGSIPAAKKAVETVDKALSEIVEAVHTSGGACVITADHGNADNMLEPDGSPNTAHSMNPVPFIVTVETASLTKKGGVLADVSPTILALLGLDQPPEMTGHSLLTEKHAKAI
jgi:2,3-bisphosphoglycerate-independent phosphoglycerate mutase